MYGQVVFTHPERERKRERESWICTFRWRKSMIVRRKIRLLIVTTDFHYTIANYLHLCKWIGYPRLFCLSARGIQQKGSICLPQILCWRKINSNFIECILCFRSCSYAVFCYSHILTKHWFFLSTFLVSYDMNQKGIFFLSEDSVWKWFLLE